MSVKFVNDNINFDNISRVENATELTVLCWVYHDNITADHIICSQATGTADGFLFFRDDTGGISGRTDVYTIFIAESTGSSNVRIESATNSSPLQQWTCVAFSYKENTASNGLRLFINGNEDANSPVSTSGIIGIVTGSARFRIGSSSDGTTTFFNGQISEFYVWDKVLTPEEIALIAKSRVKGIGLGIQKANIVTYVPLDDISEGVSGASVTFRDASGQSESGTGIDGSSDDSLLGRAETFLSYSPQNIFVISDSVLAFNESLSFTIVSNSTIQDIQNYLENLSFNINSNVLLQEFQNYIESLQFSIVVSSALGDIQHYINNLSFTINSTVSLLDQLGIPEGAIIFNPISLIRNRLISIDATFSDNINLSCSNSIRNPIKMTLKRNTF